MPPLLGRRLLLAPPLLLLLSRGAMAEPPTIVLTGADPDRIKIDPATQKYYDMDFVSGLHATPTN